MSDNDIDFDKITDETLKDKAENPTTDEPEKKQFHPDKRLWTGFGIAVAVLLIIAICVAFIM